MEIGGKPIGPGHPVYIVAEMSANHLGDLERAREIIYHAADAGADAVKLQCFKPEMLTLNSDRPEFCIDRGPWAGRRLYELYQEAYTPWEWFPGLQKLAHNVGIELFSSVLCKESVDYCISLGFPALKIPSFELVDLPLIRYAASRGKPLILSTGMATWLHEVGDAEEAARDGGCKDIVLLHCVSGYPTPASEARLNNLNVLYHYFPDDIVGLSDHSLGVAVSIAAVANSAHVIEKHLTLYRKDGGLDAGFSLEPSEFAAMVREAHMTESVFGTDEDRADSERSSLRFRRSLFAVEDIAEGEAFTECNVRSIRPADGLPPRHLPEILGRMAARQIQRGTPLTWGMIGGDCDASFKVPLDKPLDIK